MLGGVAPFEENISAIVKYVLRTLFFFHISYASFAIILLSDSSNRSHIVVS